MPTNRPRDIRVLVEQQFAEIRPGSNGIEHEALLIRDGIYCGHRYQKSDLTAVWFFEENQIKVYGAEGGVLRVICPSQHAPNQHPEAA